MKIVNCQISPLVGDIEGNLKKITALYNLYSKKGADMCVFPELALSGYLAQDLFLQKTFIKKVHEAIDNILSIKSATVLILPTCYEEKEHLYNAVLVIQNGKIIGKTYKHSLPNYGVFDEKRYFTSRKPTTITVNGIKIGFPICEDIWTSEICNKLKDQGAELFIVPNGSPYDKTKHKLRIKLAEDRYNETKIPIIYCNQMVGQDGIVFEGKSFAYDGTLHQFAPGYKTSEDIILFKNGKFTTSTFHNFSNVYEDMYAAMVLGTREYIVNNGFKHVVVGLSGGIDSALVACILADCIGGTNVTGIMLPSKFSQKQSKKDATLLADNLGLRLKEYDISKSVKAICSTFGIKFNWDYSDVTIQNIQSRVRGTILMAEANKTGALLITTGNKSEYATGYTTLYGDMNGAFNPIKDVYKTEVFALCKYRNIVSKVIPRNILEKEPSAELAPNQKDTDTLPEYSVLDPILEFLIEKNLSREEIYTKYPAEIVDKVANMLKYSEFKRFQSAPGVKISTRIFNIDRRYPISNKYSG